MLTLKYDVNLCIKMFLLCLNCLKPLYFISNIQFLYDVYNNDILYLLLFSASLKENEYMWVFEVYLYLKFNLIILLFFIIYIINEQVFSDYVYFNFIIL